MKKLISILVSAALMVTMLTGCGAEAPKADDQAAGNDKQAEEKADDKNAGDKLKIGFIYIGHINDGGFTQAHDKGRIELQDKLGDKVETLYQEGVPENAQDVKAAANTMIDQGAKLIFGNSFGYMDTFEELAKEHPDVKFMHFAGNKMNDTNFGNYFGAMEQPRYLSGIVAGLKTKSNKIGYVGAYPITELLIGIDAFALGVQSVNPNAKVQVVWTNSWYDPAKEKEAAESLLAAGCDVIAQHCDTTGPQIAAESKGAAAIGYNTDSYEAAPKAFMTAPIFNHGVFYIQQAQSVLDGTWKPESYYGDLSDGYVSLLPLTENAPDGAADKVDEVKAKMISGDFKVFTGPIKDQNGNIVVPEGKSLDRDGIWKIDYLVQGVEGTTK